MMKPVSRRPVYKQKRIRNYTFKKHIKSLLEVNGLTFAEQDVLGYLMEGMTNDEIANELCVTIKTVKLHMGNVFKKLKVKDRVKLVLKMVQYGYFMEDYNGVAPQPAGKCVKPLRRQETNVALKTASFSAASLLPKGSGA
jgi:DNA-binding CsgD family transcriptional regulator